MTEGTISVTTNVSGASVKITSGGSVYADGVATGKSFTTTNKLAPGEYTIEVSKKDYDTVTTTVVVDGDKTVNVELKESIKTGADAEVTNAIPGYENTVLVNSNAKVTVTMRDKDGNPLANRVTVLSLGTTKLGATKDPQLKVKGLEVLTTDANGKVNFVVGSSLTSLKATSTDYVASVKYTASVLGDESTTSGTISFAAVDVDKATVNNPSNLKAGTNAGEAGHTGKTTSKNLNNKDSDYVLTQQVSSKGIDNSIEFKVEPKIVLPPVSDESKAKDYQQSLNIVSGKYHTYADDPQYSQYFNLNVDANELKYASLNFDKLQLSPYTAMVVEFYSAYDAKGHIEGKDVIVKADDLEGMEKNNFAVQIPLTDSTEIKSIKVILRSVGQVQANKNDGYVIKDITGVYKDDVTKSGKGELLKSAKIKWSAVTPTYSETKEFAANTLKASLTQLDINPANNDDKFTYAVPAFPNTGNAVITEKDKNGKLVAYYLVPTENQKDGDKYKNENDIKKLNGEYVKAYKATAEEVSNYISTGVTQNEDGTIVKVDSEKSGITTLKGELSIDGIGSDLLDATNSNYYTSVQWNPIPKVAQSNSKACLAIAGQKITVTGQLVDKNGNAVSLKGESITFKHGNTDIGNGNAEGVSVVSKPATTDANGRASIVLSAAQATEFLSINATCNSNYDVKLIVGNDNVESNSADLYWVNADLQYLSELGEKLDRDNSDGKVNTTSNNTITVDAKNPTVSTPWEYGVNVVASLMKETVTNETAHTTKEVIRDTIKGGKLAGYKVTIDGLKIFTESASSNKGTYTAIKDESGKEENGKLLGNSEIANKDTVTAEINSKSVTDNVTFTATKGSDVLNFTCVGEGNPNMNAKINLNVNWQPKGVSLAMVAPKGTAIKKNNIGANGGKGKTNLYVRVMDSTGKNPLTNTKVKFTVNENAKISTSSTSVDQTEVTTTTDKYGVAEIWVESYALNTGDLSSIITASVSEMKQTTSTTINWLNDETTKSFGFINAEKTDDKQVTVTFNNKVNADTMKAGNFEITGVSGVNKDVKIGVTSVKASGNTAVLTLNDALTAGEYKLAINNKYSESGIVYTPSDVVGQTLDDDDTINFYTSNASFKLDEKDGTVEISEINTPSVTDSNADNFNNSNSTTRETSFANKFVVVVDGEIKTLVASNGSTSSGEIALTSSAENSFEFTIASDTKEHEVCVYYMGGSDKATVKTQSDIANSHIAADTKDVETTGKVTAGTNVASPMNFGATGTNGSTITATLLSETPGATYTDSGSNKITIGGTADGTVIFDVKISKTNGTDVYKTFKATYTHTGTTYKCEDITGSKEANDAAIEAAIADINLFAASYNSASAVKATSDSANKYGVTLTWSSNDTKSIEVNSSTGAVTAHAYEASVLGKTLTCEVTRGNGTKKTVVYGCTFGGSSSAPTVNLTKKS